MKTDVRGNLSTLNVVYTTPVNYTIENFEKVLSTLADKLPVEYIGSNTYYDLHLDTLVICVCGATGSGIETRKVKIVRGDLLPLASKTEYKQLYDYLTEIFSRAYSKVW